MTMQDTATVEQRWARTLALKKQVFATNKTTVFNALREAGLTLVVVAFDGSGDSGQIESVEAHVAEELCDLPRIAIEQDLVDQATLEIRPSTSSLQQAIENLAYEPLEDRYFGWEDGEGAHGEITFDVAAETITVDFNARYIASENSTCQF